MKAGRPWVTRAVLTTDGNSRHREPTLKKRVLLLLANGFESYEASSFVDAIGWNRVDVGGTTELAMCILMQEITGLFGIHVAADLTVNERRSIPMTPR